MVEGLGDMGHNRKDRSWVSECSVSYKVVCALRVATSCVTAFAAKNGYCVSAHLS